MKNAGKWMLVLALCILGLGIHANAQDDIRVTLNGRTLEFDQPPIMQDDRTLVPVRAICEALGADVYYIGVNDHHYFTEVYVVKNDIKLCFVIDFIGESNVSKYTAKDFDEYFMAPSYDYYTELDVGIQIVNDRMLVPLRALGEGLGIDVEWDGNTHTAVLTCPQEFIDDINRDKTFFLNSFGISTMKESHPAPKRTIRSPNLMKPSRKRCASLPKKSILQAHQGRQFIKYIRNSGRRKTRG